MIEVLSLGAGVQSSTLALMAAHGEVEPMPTAAIFADTQAEPDSVYKWLDWLEKQLPFPVHRVTKGSLEAEALSVRTSKKTGLRFSRTSIPVFVRCTDGFIGRIPQRTCTRDFKIRPIVQTVRRIAKVPRGCKEVVVTQWIGISLDEIQRMKPAREVWIKNRWPLVEKRMTRYRCLEWMKSHGYQKPPRSSCVFCPFHSLNEWRMLRDTEPEAWNRAIEFEISLQRAHAGTDTLTRTPYLHRSCKPLDQVDLRTDKDHGQLWLWQDECSGMCGV